MKKYNSKNWHKDLMTLVVLIGFVILIIWVAVYDF